MKPSGVRGVGLLGCGTVGGEVAGYLVRERSAQFKIHKIAVREPGKPRRLGRLKDRLTTDWREVVDHPDVDVVLELMGGEQPAFAAMKRALERGKAVVTANKLVLSRHGRELYDLARRQGVYLGLRATIAGIHPMIFFLHLALPAGKSIRSLHAVLNGTCNFVLDEMESASRSFEDAVRVAQKLGYAEADPSLDVLGRDTFHKISIIHQLVYGVSAADGRISPDRGLCEGIDRITAEDLHFAAELGYRVKLLGTIESVEGRRSIRVHPALVPKEHVLALLKGAENGMVMVDDYGEKSGYTGLGAGAKPTRIAVLQDLHAWAAGQAGVLPGEGRTLNLLPADEIASKYFLKFTVIDRAGVLAQISRVLWRHNISISAVIQKERREGDRVPLIITTHETMERSMRRSFKEILRLSVVRSPSTFLRIVP
ncbi:MAG: homoserine dehydrogenase [Nitrospirae bacterium]|nr:homoserine dehydrogenase [Nitrospirota bacterium]